MSIGTVKPRQYLLQPTKQRCFDKTHRHHKAIQQKAAANSKSFAAAFLFIISL